MKNLISKVTITVIFVFIFSALTGCACEHEWKDATCTEPKTCTKCGETQGEAFGHVWLAATCTEPQTCVRCSKVGEPATGHIWTVSDGNNPSVCSICGEMKPLPQPDTGEILIGDKPDSYNSSELSINNSAESACFIKLKDSGGNDKFGFYVRAGDDVTVNVPCGKFYVYFASGDDWYGPELCFGDDTYYSKDDELLDFNTYTWSYTLYPITNGNFEETPIDESEFK